MKTLLTLGTLTDALKACDASEVRIAAPKRIVPVRLDSYRGYYSDLAIDYRTIDYDVGDRLTMSRVAFIKLLHSADRKTFIGYKGGEYFMNRDTDIWISTYGECSGMRISGVQVDNNIAYLIPFPQQFKS